MSRPTGLLRQAASSPRLSVTHRLVGKAGICKFLRREPRGRRPCDIAQRFLLSEANCSCASTKAQTCVAHLAIRPFKIFELANPCALKK